jgi:hypothetical protein
VVVVADGKEMEVYNGFHDFADDRHPQDLISPVVVELDIDYVQELDI